MTCHYAFKPASQNSAPRTALMLQCLPPDVASQPCLAVLLRPHSAHALPAPLRLIAQCPTHSEFTPPCPRPTPERCTCPSRPPGHPVARSHPLQAYRTASPRPVNSLKHRRLPHRCPPGARPHDVNTGHRDVLAASAPGGRARSTRPSSQGYRLGRLTQLREVARGHHTQGPRSARSEEEDRVSHQVDRCR